MMQAIDLSLLSYRELPLEQMRVYGSPLGLKLENKMHNALQFSYSHVTREGVTVKLILACERGFKETLRIPVAPSALFMIREDPVLLSPRPFLSVSFFAKKPSDGIPEEYQAAYREAMDQLEKTLITIDPKEGSYEYSH